MARDWKNDGWDQEWSDYFTEQPRQEVNNILFGDLGNVDWEAQQLFREAFFDNNKKAYAELIEYMNDEYGIDFEDSFAWEDFREWYLAQQG